MADEANGVQDPEIKAALEWIDAVSEMQRLKHEIVLANGIKLRTKAIPQGAIKRAVARIPLPKPPVVMIESKGREEENPDDPDYLEALEAAHRARLEATWKVMYALGTEFAEAPEGLYGPADDGWIDELQAAGIPLEITSKAHRYIEWLEAYAMTNASDHSTITATCMMLTGTLESEVMQAIEFFRSRTPWRNAAGSPGGEDDRQRTDDSAGGAGSGS